MNTVATDSTLQPLVQRLHEGNKTYNEVSHNIRSNSLQAEYALNLTGKTSRAMLGHVDMEADYEDNNSLIENAFQMFHAIGASSGYSKAYNVINSPRTMESQKIPRPIWLE